MWWKTCGGRLVVEDMWWKTCGGRLVVKNMWWKTCGGRLMVEDLWIAKYKYNEFIEAICIDIMTHNHLFMTKKLVTTGTDPVPVEIDPDGVIIYGQDMKTMQEEADTMIAKQVYVADVRPKKTVIVADDTCFLCCYFPFVQRRHTSFSIYFTDFTRS